MTASLSLHRRTGVDALRGVAILLMVLDHVLVQVDSDHLLRLTVTRWSLPLFVGCAMAVRAPDRQLRPARLRILAGAIVIETVLGPTLHLGVPGPVALIALVLLVDHLPWVWPRWDLIGTAGLLQALYLPIPWGGYQPGLVLAWATLGLGAVVLLEQPAGRHLPGWVAGVGRRPVLWYVGHLLVLAAVVVAL